MKTNNQWYPYPRFGSYYKLEDGELHQCAMNADGSRDENPVWVDLNFTVEPRDRADIQALIKDLELKD